MNEELVAARRMKFLSAYAECGVIGPACDVAGVDRSTYKRWRKSDAGFSDACDDAFQSAVDAAELELRTRAVGGVEEVVLYRGEPVFRRDPHTGQVLLDDDFDPIPFTIHRKSDRLLEVYVRSHRPVYKERTEVALTGGNGGPVETGITIRYVMPDGQEQDHGERKIPEDPLDD